MAMNLTVKMPIKHRYLMMRKGYVSTNMYVKTKLEDSEFKVNFLVANYFNTNLPPPKPDYQLEKFPRRVSKLLIESC